MSNCAIIRMSSCSMLWQWNTKRPETGLGTVWKFAGNGKRIFTSPRSPPMTIVSLRPRSSGGGVEPLRDRRR